LKKLTGLIVVFLFVSLIALVFVLPGCGADGFSSPGNNPIGNNPTPGPTPSNPSVPSEDWLTYLNHIRSMANLPPVTSEHAYVDGNIKHSRYMVKNNWIGHDQDPSNPHYTPEGREAARNSNLYLTTTTNLGHVESINAWITGPFHGVGMIDPKLRRAGYGSYSESKSGYQAGSGLDILRGLGTIPPSVNYPIMWPAHGKTTHLRRYNGGEHPNPLSGTGFSAPSGAPIYLQLGPGNITPRVTAHSLKRNGVDVPHAVYDQTSYQNSDSGSQSLGRGVLSSRSTIIMMPKDPLVAGATYDVSITSSGTSYSWSFNVASDARSIGLDDNEGQINEFIIK
jgi:hypothetical protein